MGVIAEATVRVRPETRGFQKEASAGILPSVKRVAGGVLGAFAAVQIGSKIAHGLFIDPIKQAGDFQQTLNVLQATVGATSDQMSQASATALKLGADTRLPATSANDAALAMTELAKAGFNVKQSMAAARGVLELSAAGQLDNATAAQIAANSLNQFQLAAGKSGMVADLLAGAANASSGSVQDMAESLQFAGTAAHGAGVPITDTVAAISEMANQGLAGSIAGSSFAQMLRSLQAPTSKAKDALDSMNISLYDQNGRLKSMPDIIGQFSTALDGMTDKQKNQTLATVFGSRAVQAARIILGGGVKAYEKMRDAVSKTGAAQRLAEAQTKGFNGVLKGLQSNIETLQVKLGLALLPKLSQFVGFLSDLAGAPNVSVALHIAFSGVESAVGDLMGSLKRSIFGAAGSLKPIKLDSGKIISFERTRGSIGLFDELKDALVAAPWGKIGDQVGDAIGKSIHVSTDAINGMFDSLLSAFQAHQGQIAEVAVELVAQFFVTLTDPSFWLAHWKLAAAVAISAISLVFAPVKFLKFLEAIPILRFLVKPLEALGGKLVEIGGGAMAKFGTAIWEGLVRIAPRTTAALVRIIEEFGLLPTRVGIFALRMSERLAGVLERLGGRAGALAGRVVTAIVRFFVTLPGRVGGRMVAFVAIIVANLARGASQAAVGAAHIAANIISGLVNKLSGIGQSVAHQLSHIQDAIGGVAGAAAGWAAHIGEEIVSGIVSGVGGLYDQLKSKLEGALHSVMSTLNPFSPVAHGGQIYIGEPIMQGAIAGIEGMVPALSKSLSDAVRSGVRGAGGDGLGVSGGGALASQGSGIHLHGVTIMANSPEEFMEKLNRIAVRVA